MKKVIQILFLAVCLFGFSSSSKAERADYNNWLVRVDVNSTIGLVFDEIQDDPNLYHWHKNIEYAELTISLLPFGQNLFRNFVIWTNGIEAYGIYPGLEVVHSVACQLIWMDPVEAYEYAYFEAC